MKIISNFKDYYDYLINQYGIDNHIVFERNNKKIEINSENSIFNNRSFISFNRSPNNSIREDFWFFCDHNYPIDKEQSEIFKHCSEKTILLYFCGKFYKCKKSMFLRKSYGHVEKTTYDFEPIHVDNKEMKKYFTEHNIVSALIYGINVDERINKSCFKVEINPKLAEIMGTKFTPEEVYQEIEMFLGKAKENVELVEVSNDQKIVKSGFDLKKSFRKQSKK